MKTKPENESNTYSFCIRSDKDIPNLTEAIKVPWPEKITKDKFKETTADGQLIIIDSCPDFSFEKERMKAIENSQLFSSVNTGDQQVIINSDKIKELMNIAEERHNIVEKKKERIANGIKSLCIIFTLIGTANIIVEFFAMIILAITNIPLTGFLWSFIYEIFSTIIFIILCIKGSNIENFSVSAINTYLKFSILYLLILGIVTTLIELKENTITTIRKAMEWGNTGNSYEAYINTMNSIMLLCVIGSTLYKFIGIFISCILCSFSSFFIFVDILCCDGLATCPGCILPFAQ